MGNCLETNSKKCFVCKDSIDQPKYLQCCACNLDYHFVCLLHELLAGGGRGGAA